MKSSINGITRRELLFFDFEFLVEGTSPRKHYVFSPLTVASGPHIIPSTEFSTLIRTLPAMINQDRDSRAFFTVPTAEVLGKETVGIQHSSDSTIADWAREAYDVGKRLARQSYEHPGMTALSVLGVAAGVAAVAAFKVPARSVYIPMLSRETLGTASEITARTFKASDPLARTYARVSQGIAKVEVIGTGGKGSFSDGTAFAVSKDGKLLTANHVVEGKCDFTLVDRRGNVHEAIVLVANKEEDIAVLQLTNPASYKAFKPLKLASKTTGLKPEQVATAGHPGGVNDIILSQGYDAPIPISLIQPHKLVTPIAVRTGNSGGPLFNRAGEAVGVDIAVAPAIGRPFTYLTATDIRVAENLLTNLSKPTVFKPKSASAFDYTSNWHIGDKAAARKDLELLLNRSLTDKSKHENFHSTFTQISMNRGSIELTARASLNTAQRTLTIRPVAINGKPLEDGMIWGKTSRIKDALLKVQLDRKLNPIAMSSYNDPADVLRVVFNSAGGKYLPGLTAGA